MGSCSQYKQLYRLRILIKILKIVFLRFRVHLIKNWYLATRNSQNVASSLKKNSFVIAERFFSCQNVDLCFRGLQDELEARNKSKPHQHIEIYPMTVFQIFDTASGAPQNATGRFRGCKCPQRQDLIFLIGFDVSTSFWVVLTTTKTPNLLSPENAFSYGRKFSL